MNALTPCKDEFKHYLITQQQRVNDYLMQALATCVQNPDITPNRGHTSKVLPASNISYSNRLLDALHYSIFNGGKRLRPTLVYATGEALGAHAASLDAPAAAIELIHCYSLIHDDLPAMDDDDLRRGKPTCHKAFDEATAILAGDALQSLAFEILARDQIPAPTLSAAQRLAQIKMLAMCSGIQGMVGGQAMDMEASQQSITLEALVDIHRKKTGALIVCSVRFGAMAAGCTDPNILTALEDYAGSIGLSFQVQDDILDVIGDKLQLGKNTGQDEYLQKATFPSLLGLAEAKRYARDLHAQALASLETVLGKQSNASPLAKLSEFFIQRLS